MKATAKYLFSFLVFFVLLLFPVLHAVTQEYEAMQGVESVRVVYDFRVGDQDTALAHLGLIHDMLDDPNMAGDGSSPEIVVVFIGSSVNLIAPDELGAAEGPQDPIAEKISAMEEDGVRFEVCMTAAHALDVDPESILPEIVQVGNGWISVIGYQQQGYSLIANM